MAATKLTPTSTTLLYLLVMAQRMAKTTGLSVTPGLPLGVKQVTSSCSDLKNQTAPAVMTSLLLMEALVKEIPPSGKYVALAAS